MSRNRWACVCRLGGIGDNLVAASVLAPLKRQGYMVEVITSTPHGVVYLHNPHIDKLALKNAENDLPRNDLLGWQKWMESRAREYDIFVHASHSMEGRHAFFPAMTDFWLSEDYRRKRAAGSYLETVHDLAGVQYDFGPLYYSSPDEIELALQAKRTFFGQYGNKCLLWIISGTRLDKLYPYSAFAIARIIKELGIPVLVMGGPSEREYTSALAIKEHVEHQNGSREGLGLAVPPGATGAAAWGVRQGLTFATHAADLVVTPDTGPAWAVAFEPVPKILLLSHASVENITKHWLNTTTLHADPNRVPCWPCHRLHDDKSTCVENKEKNGAACISDISVETIVQTVKREWRRRHDNVVHAERLFTATAGGSPVVPLAG